MSMQELTDDQLDGLFRKSSEEFNPTFDPAAWQAMQARLDEHDRTIAGQSKWRNRLIRWGLPLLLLVLLPVSSWYYISQKSTSKETKSSQPVTNRDVPAGGRSAQQTQAKAATPTQQPAEANNTATEAPQSGVLTEQSEESISASAPKTKRQSSVNRPQQPYRISSTSPGTEVVETKKDLSTRKLTPAKTPVPMLAAANTSLANRGKRRRSFTRTKQPMTINNEKIGLNPVVGHTSTTSPVRQSAITANPDWTPSATEVVIGSQSASGMSATESSQSDTRSAVTELRNRTGQWPRLTAAINRPVLARPDTATQQRFVSKPQAERGLSVRFVVSPDLSAVGLKNFARPGTNVGLMLEYRLARRWSVQGGALWSTKVYKTSQVPAYTLGWRVVPEGVSGQCSLFDIPINVRYDIHLGTDSNDRVRSRWFIIGGATTYIMQQEDYTYEYADPTNPHIYSDKLGWHGKTGRYNFSHLNVSIGYERAISHRLSWQAEPFLKVPLQGVGYYKLNLLSTGAFLSLRYKL